MIIVTPLLLLQVVTTSVFYETHWDIVTKRLARGVAGDIATVIALMPADGDLAAPRPPVPHRPRNHAARHRLRAAGTTCRCSPAWCAPPWSIAISPRRCRSS